MAKIDGNKIVNIPEGSNKSYKSTLVSIPDSSKVHKSSTDLKVIPDPSNNLSNKETLVVIPDNANQ